MIKFVYIFLILAFSIHTFSQDIDKIRSERELLLQEIESSRELLNTKISSREEVFKQVNLLTNQISSRENLIKNFNAEIDLLDSQIELNQLNINELEVSINSIKGEYVKLLQEIGRAHV